MTIAWEDVRAQSVLDGVGRSFRWTELKGKRIYMCGHGAHIFRDGYCAVPPNTTVNFYQTYGKLLNAPRAYDFIDGSQNYQSERSFSSGQSCPNMTLFEDDAHCITATVEALKRRLGSNNLSHMDHFNFNCNQFSGLSVHKPLLPRPVLERAYPGNDPRHSETRKPLQAPPLLGKGGKGINHMLKLEEILTVLQGNTIEWMCCQDLNVDRYKVEIGQTPKKPKMNTDGLSDRVKAGLDAMAEVSAGIARSHVPRLKNPRVGTSTSFPWIESYQAARSSL